MGHRPEMVLMGVGEHQPQQVRAALDDKGGVGHHDLDAGDAVVAERHAEIDHQPLAVEAVEVEVHADLAAAAERHEQQLVVALRHGHAAPRLRRQISTIPESVRSGSVCSMVSVPPAKSGASPPVATTFIGTPNSRRMRSTSPSIRLT